MAVRKSQVSSKRTKAPGRPRKFSHQQLVDAALAVMDREGFKELSLRSLAQELGISHSVLYTYIEHVEDVAADALHALASELPLPISNKPAALRKEFLAYTVAAHEMLSKHPQIMFSPMGSTSWKTFIKVSIAWIEALTPFAVDSVGAAQTYNFAISYIAINAQQERVWGKDYKTAGVKILGGLGIELRRAKGSSVTDHVETLLQNFLPKLR